MMNIRPHLPSDPSQSGKPLDAIFQPRNIAVIGATEKAGSVGRTIFSNLNSGAFASKVFPVNPIRDTVLGVKTFSSIKSVPVPIDLAVIVTPARTVPGVVAECAAAGVRGAIIISAGFKECGSEGAKLETEILQIARGANMRIVGPNCLGVMSPLHGLNATFAGAMARPGNVAFLSQSGALCTAILDWSLREDVGFSAFVSAGSMLDVGWGDLIDYFGDDPRTRSIVIYMESIGDVRSFISAAREVTRTKPIVVIKAGRTEAAARAAASHTGALTGSYDVLEAAFRRTGVLSVNTIAELFYMADVLSKQPRPAGPRLTIVTNAGGPGVLATDSLMSGGGKLAELSKESRDALSTVLPAHWSHANPIDLLGDADAARYCNAIEIAARDPDSDGMLVILSPQAMTDPTQTAEQLKRISTDKKPMLASWMGGSGVAAGAEILHRAGIPVFSYPDTAARIFNYMWRYSNNLKELYETPSALEEMEDFSGREKSRLLIESIRDSGRTLLTELESKSLLALNGIPTVETRLAMSEEEAVEHLTWTGLPAVLKLNSFTLTHKTDVDGVKLGLSSPGAVRCAYREIEASVTERAGAAHFNGVTVQPMVSHSGYELILGSSVDPQFGPVLLFGLGGQLVEVLKDRALALPPLNTTLARRTMEQTKIYQALKGVRGRKAVNLVELEKLMVRFSQMAVEQRWIKEIEINPLIVSADRILALDARVVLYGKDVLEKQLPRTAIRPYPAQYVKSFKLKNGKVVSIRPIRPEDESLLVNFHKGLSEQTVYLRYFNTFQLSQRITHERLSRLCFIDYDREMSLIAEHRLENGEREMMGLARMIKLSHTGAATFSATIADPHQGQGLGGELLARIIQVARDEKIEYISGGVHAENAIMLHVCRKLGFTLEPVQGEPLVHVKLMV